MKHDERGREEILDVYEAVTSRRAVRGFTGRPIPKEVQERVLSAAAWSLSGSNFQPWHAYVLTGAPLAEIKKRAGERVAAGPSYCGGNWIAHQNMFRHHKPDVRAKKEEVKS